MRIFQAKRIYMNEADASPGNGAPANPPATPAPTAAPTAPESAPSVTPDQVKSWIGDALGGFKNEFFANARKAGLLKKDEPAPPAPTPASAPASTGLSADDVKAMIARENAIARISTETKLSAAQERWLRDAVEASKPDDVLGYCKSFVTDLGLAKAPETQPQVTPQVQPNAAPVSDKGSPAPGTATSWQRELAERPLSMSAAARAAMDTELGTRVAQQKRIEAARALHGTSLRVTPK